MGYNRLNIWEKLGRYGDAARGPLLIAPLSASDFQKLILSETDDKAKQERTRGRMLAIAYFALGWGLAYWFWPADLSSSGALLHAFASWLIGVAGTVLARILW